MRDTPDRRKSAREPVRISLWIGHPNGDTDEPLSVNNVSQGGLQFRSRKAWVEGSAVQVHINVERPLELGGKVMRCTERPKRFKLPWQQAGTVYEVGVEFVESDPARCGEVVEQIFLSEAYQRGLNI